MKNEKSLCLLCGALTNSNEHFKARGHPVFKSFGEGQPPYKSVIMWDRDVVQELWEKTRNREEFRAKTGFEAEVLHKKWNRLRFSEKLSVKSA